MQSCSILGCESYKSIQWKPVAYFKFPFNNKKLLSSWLVQINQKNFSPTIQDQICSTHFLIEDIEPSSIGRYPILKPDAIPSVFPEGREKIPPPKEKFGTPRPDMRSLLKAPNSVQNFEKKFKSEAMSPKTPLKGNVSPQIYPQAMVQASYKTDIKSPIQTIKSPIQTIKSPIQTIKSPIQTIKSPLQLQARGIPVQITPLQIQPKPAQTKKKPVQIQKVQLPQRHVAFQSLIQGKPTSSPKSQLQKSQLQTQQVSPNLKPKKQATTNGAVMPVKQLSDSQLHEILSGQDNVKQEVSPPKAKQNVLAQSKSENVASESRRPILKISINKFYEASEKKSSKRVKKSPEEVLVKTTDKSVIFRLDPSGKIVVETINNNATPQVTNKIVEKTPKVKTPDPRLTNLKTLYNKAHEDCVKLSKKLSTLKQRHQEEQEQIFKLQGILPNPKKEEILNSDTSSSVMTKKRKVIGLQEEEDEYEKLLREVRKIKEDHDKMTVAKTSNKDSVNIKTEEISIDSDEQDLEKILTQDETINTTTKRKQKKKRREAEDRLIELSERKTLILPQKSFNLSEKKSALSNKRKSPMLEGKKVVKKSFVSANKIPKRDEDIVGLIDESVGFDSDDEMNFEVEYLDPEFVDC